jgi:HAD superfamily hydrolase (TIGR01509 family)
MHKNSRLNLIFDCDGVLVDSEGISMEVELQYLSDLGLKYDLSEYKRKLFGLSAKDYTAHLKRDYLALGRGEFPDNVLKIIKSERWARYSGELKTFDGIRALLEGFDGEVAIASSSSVTSVKKKLKLTGLSNYFDGRIYSEDMVSSGKPAPDLIRFVVAQLKASPHECLLIEDSVNGVQAGVEAGVHVWGFTGGSHADEDLARELYAAGAEKVFSNFHDIGARLTQLID